MTTRMRTGKAYENIVLGMLTFNKLDVYQPLVDDQGIDGLIRILDDKGKRHRYYELQIKGAKTWNNIRCKVAKMSKNGVLILYSAGQREILWFLYEELSRYFPTLNPKWGDIYLTRENVQKFIAEGRSDIGNLFNKL
jgi:hypothetical protein